MFIAGMSRVQIIQWRAPRVTNLLVRGLSSTTFWRAVRGCLRACQEFLPSAALEPQLPLPFVLPLCIPTLRSARMDGSCHRYERGMAQVWTRHVWLRHVSHVKDLWKMWWSVRICERFQEMCFGKQRTRSNIGSYLTGNGLCVTPT